MGMNPDFQRFLDPVDPPLLGGFLAGVELSGPAETLRKASSTGAAWNHDIPTWPVLFRPGP